MEFRIICATSRRTTRQVGLRKTLQEAEAVVEQLFAEAVKYREHATIAIVDAAGRHVSCRRTQIGR